MNDRNQAEDRFLSLNKPVKVSTKSVTGVRLKLGFCP